MRTLYPFTILTLGLALAAGNGCSGDSKAFSNPGDSGSDAGGGSGGSGASSGASGSTGRGGSAGSGGSTGGSAGSAGDAGTCAPSSDRSRAALCLTLEPEQMQFEADQRLDGRGILIVEIFGTPSPDGVDGGADVPALTAQAYPPQLDGGPPIEAPITQLPELRFENLPTTVYVRAFFADNFETFTVGGSTWGTWIGGYNLAAGLIENPPIVAVQLMPGAGRSYRLPLVALRRLRATLTLASGVTPLDDGQGPASVVAVRLPTPRENEPIYGVASSPCASVASGSSAPMDGILIGSGAFYLAAGIDDYDLGGSLTPGGLFSIEVSGNMYSLPATSRVTVAPTAYTVTHIVPLTFAVPLGDAGTPAPYACPTVDAGTGG